MIPPKIRIQTKLVIIQVDNPSSPPPWATWLKLKHLNLKCEVVICLLHSCHLIYYRRCVNHKFYKAKDADDCF